MTFQSPARGLPTYPSPGEGTVIYAVGDIHGRSDLLDELLARIDADRARLAGARTLEVYLGDYVDRGPDTAGVIDRLIRRFVDHRAVCLKGNHEDVLLRFLAEPQALQHWRRLGGLETLASYGIRAEGADPYEVAEAFAEALPHGHRIFLDALPSVFPLGPYVFAHAGLRPGVPLEAQRDEDLLWIRQDFLDSDADFGAVVVHGHTPVEAVDFRPNRINVDTGAVVTGALSCVRIAPEGVRLL